MSTTALALRTESVAEKAAPLLTAMVNWKAVQEVAVFGSVAREGNGNDLDVVLVVGPKAYAAYISTVWSLLLQNGGDVYYNLQSERFEAATKALKLSSEEVAWFGTLAYYFGRSIDIHLMPNYWRKDADAVQADLPHSDPEFVKHVVADAISVKTSNNLNGLEVVYRDWRSLR